MNAPILHPVTAKAKTDKTHYAILDGLRGVASLMVVVFHLSEAFAPSDRYHQVFYHGYLAVDFFFLLSGFVIAYAYDDRWPRMSEWQFLKRRLIRLQPMIIIGSLVGGALFWFQDFSIYPKVPFAAAWQVVLVMLIGCTMLPLPRYLDVRGWNEAYPLNGPAWSMLYEYCTNVLYACVLRKLSNRALAVVAVVAAMALVDLAMFGSRGSLMGGSRLDIESVRIGLTRSLFPFVAGMLLMRLGKRITLKGGFLICSLLLVTVLTLPRLGDASRPWLNGLCDAGFVILLFPLIVAIGAGDKQVEGWSIKIAKFFGDLSYPLYITHYPLIYIYVGWVTDNKIPIGEGAVVGVLVFAASIAIALAFLKFYDEPVRKMLAR